MSNLRARSLVERAAFSRDGPSAQMGLDKGAGVADQEMLPGTRLVRAFNALNFKLLMSSRNHPGELIAVRPSTRTILGRRASYPTLHSTHTKYDP